MALEAHQRSNASGKKGDYPGRHFTQQKSGRANSDGETYSKKLGHARKTKSAASLSWVGNISRLDGKKKNYWV